MVEVIGGIEPARSLILAALERGASVVTANKALLAEDGADAVRRRGRAAGVDLYYEAARRRRDPAAAPAARVARRRPASRRVLGIVNGTTNYILSRMAETGAGFAEALAEATELGYAEADPTADVEGFDAAAKAAILASLAFHTRVTAADVYREGITAVTRRRRRQRRGDGLRRQAARDLPSAAARRARRVVGVRVHPAMIPRTHPLAAVGEAFNAVFVEAEAAGQLMFYGRGAGGEPTASAVLGDLVAVARNRLRRRPRAGRVGVRRPARPADGRDAAPATTSASTSPTSPACWPTSRSAFADTASRSRPSGRRARGDDATLVLVTHTAHRRGAVGAPSSDAARAATSCATVASVLRVEGE